MYDSRTHIPFSHTLTLTLKPHTAGHSRPGTIHATRGFARFGPILLIWQLTPSSAVMYHLIQDRYKRDKSITFTHKKDYIKYDG